MLSQRVRDAENRIEHRLLHGPPRAHRTEALVLISRLRRETYVSCQRYVRTSLRAWHSHETGWHRENFVPDRNYFLSGTFWFLTGQKE